MNNDLQELSTALRAGSRRHLAKAISLVESQLDQDTEAREQLLSSLLPFAGHAHRIGITGAPGVGKSTLIESLGMEMLHHGHRVAVLAVDPSSSRSGGSILGDKLRMPELSQSENAFVRPSPSGQSRGGTTQRTREVIVLCEAAGYDTVIVETVGVGQAEYAVSDMVDLFVLLLLPTAGDDVQAVKRGIMEMADILVLTKADISTTHSQSATASLRSVADLVRSRFGGWKTQICSVSALHNSGIAELSESCDSFFERCADAINEQRVLQRKKWFDDIVYEQVLKTFFQKPNVSERYVELSTAVQNGTLLPLTAVRQLFESTL